MKTDLILDDVSSLSVIVNSKVGQLRDDSYSRINELEKWLNGILNQTEDESKIKKNRCEICYSKENRSNLQGHHVAGRKHDYRQITACIPCHDILSLQQKVWDVRWLNYNVSENLRNAFFLLGLRDLLMLKAKKTGISQCEMLAYSLTEGISEYLKRDSND